MSSQRSSPQRVGGVDRVLDDLGRGDRGTGGRAPSDLEALHAGAPCAGRAPRSTVRRARGSPRTTRRRGRSSGARSDRGRRWRAKAAAAYGLPVARKARRISAFWGVAGGVPATAPPRRRPAWRRRRRRSAGARDGGLLLQLGARAPPSTGSARRVDAQAARSTRRSQDAAPRAAGAGARARDDVSVQLVERRGPRTAARRRGLVERDAEAELIGARVGGVAAELLGRHVRPACPGSRRCA